MFFLIRAAFWFSLVLLALPFNTGTDDANGQSIGAIQALAAAGEAVSDISGLCQRKPDVCEAGKSAMHTVTVRAIKTAKIAASMLNDDSDANAPDQSALDQSALDTATTTGSVPASN
ncbi:DUF5330 domain-containing protein [Mesorhizobium sp. A623]